MVTLSNWIECATDDQSGEAEGGHRVRSSWNKDDSKVLTIEDTTVVIKDQKGSGVDTQRGQNISFPLRLALLHPH